MIRRDNGVPLASSSIALLSQLSVHWLNLAIRHEFVESASPHENGRNERLHRTLKADTARPSTQSLEAQQRRFGTFLRISNEERPHEALDLETPAAIHRPSNRSVAAGPKDDYYPPHFEVRIISQDKTIRWKNQKVFVRNLLKRE